MAQLSLEQSTADSAALQEYERRLNWETGNMDYMGKDSFDNIWAKICQTIEEKDIEEKGETHTSPQQTENQQEKPSSTNEIVQSGPVSLSDILKSNPSESEYMETLPAEPPVRSSEEDEIIFSKPENRPSLGDIVEEEESLTGSVPVPTVEQSGKTGEVILGVTDPKQIEDLGGKEELAKKEGVEVVKATEVGGVSPVAEEKTTTVEEQPEVTPPEKTTRSDSLKDEGKKGVFTKILEIVGVSPKGKKESNGKTSNSVFYDVENDAEPPKGEEASEMIEKSVADVTQEPIKEGETPTVSTKEAPAEKIVSEKETGESLPPGNKVEKEIGPKTSDPAAPDESFHLKDSSTNIKRKSPSPLSILPKKEEPPRTAVTMPTPPILPEVPKDRRNSALLTVDESILETPPVSEGKVASEIEEILGRAKSEAESILQETPEHKPEAASTKPKPERLEFGKTEEVEELKVTTPEERERHKGEVTTSKLSDQILKAIPPPRRKAISESKMEASSSIPKTPEEEKSATKPAKPSAIPVPPPRSKAKPPPPKGKTKK